MKTGDPVTKRTSIFLNATAILLTAGLAPSPAVAQNWPMFGQNLANSASATSPGGNLSPKQINKLKLKWTFTTGGDVSARAAVVNGIAYFPDWGGNLYALNAETGQVIWSHQLSDYGLAAGTVSRTSPTVVDGMVYIGTQYVAPASSSSPQPPTGWLLAIHAVTGTLAWKVQPDTTNATPVITASPTVVGKMVYVGMTANDEFAAADPTFVCCAARGSVVAVNATNGAVLWETFTVPTGYSGGAIWGSSPAVDISRGTVYVGTGNNYSIPTDPTYAACITAGGTESSCISPDDHIDSIIALNMKTGAVKWATRLAAWGQTGVVDGSDSWNVGCAVPPFTDCPSPTGPDYDFGSGPNEITYSTQNGPKTIIGAGQKSGIYYALDPDNGSELWHTQVGPGSTLGGIEWGSASDGQAIYVAISNFNAVPYNYGSAGSWAALNPATGAILWQIADPNGSIDLGPMTVANGVVFAESMAGGSTQPTMFALDAINGNTLWSFAAGSSVIAGATIANNTVYWGSGYAHLGIPGYTGNNKFYAFR